MSDKTRIGELLLLKERIDPWILTNTLKEQTHTRQRLISLLISRAQLDADEGAMLLSEQLGYPAAMQRHLERRDAALLPLVPPQLGSTWVVLPIGYSRTGALIVVARDPTPILTAALEHIVRKSVILAVTPSVQLERIVRASYGGAGTPEDEPLPNIQPTLSDIGDVRLEDSTPLPIRRARTVSYMFEGRPELPVRARQQVSPIDATLSEVDRAITAGAAERLVMSYAARRWHSALLVRLEDGEAVGVRGHGVDNPERVRIASTEPSRIEAEAGSLLGTATPATALVTAGTEVVGVLVVGDPVDGPAHATELDRLVDALGAAYARFSRS